MNYTINIVFFVELFKYRVKELPPIVGKGRVMKVVGNKSG